MLFKDPASFIALCLKGANQAVQCALLGTQTTMIGAVGDDANGTWYLEKLAKSGRVRRNDNKFVFSLENTAAGEI